MALTLVVSPIRGFSDSRKRISGILTGKEFPRPVAILGIGRGINVQR
jgi:hypothetical protein